MHGKIPARRTRVQTHVPGLDTVLGGGLLRGGVYVLRGAPGSGKTILGNQVCFAQASRGGRSTYVTLLAESHARMMLHLESFDFFDPELAEQSVRYLSAYDALAKNGLRGVLEFIRGDLKLSPTRVAKASPDGTDVETILAIDGFLTISDHAGSVADLKRFLQELQLYADLIGATVLLIAGPAADESRPEYTMVDGIIELSENLIGVRAYRELRVRKLRGGAHLRGAHIFSITDQGIVVHPRVEAVYCSPSMDDPCGPEYLSTGVEQLDEMLRGGFRCGTTTLVLGPSGSGKTTLGLQYLAAAPKGQPSLLFGFYETPKRILEKARMLALPLDERVASGELEIVWQASTEQNVDELAQRLVDAVERTRARRVFIDGLDGFQRATLHLDRVHNIFTAIANEMRVRGVTTIYTFEVPKFLGPNLDSPITGVSSLADNLLFLRFIELRSHLFRLMSILKVRDSDYDTTLREFHIMRDGIRLEKTFDTAEAILAGDVKLR